MEPREASTSNDAGMWDGLSEGIDWNPRTARAASQAHTWVSGWHDGGLEAIVADALGEGWECLVVDSASNGPIAPPARLAIQALGARVVDPDRDQIAAALAMVDELLGGRRWDRHLGMRQRSDWHPFLVLVGDGDHLRHEVLDLVANLGREFDVHLGIDERCRGRISRSIENNVFSVYRRPDLRVPQCGNAATQ